MRIDVLTLFPEMFESPLSCAIVKRAQDAGIVKIALTNIREFATDNYRKVDDKPYGGGPGMVMMPGPVFDAVEHVQELAPEKARVILLTPQGRTFNQPLARQLAKAERLLLIAGKYEGFDERIRTGLDAEQISIGDYVLNGGEIPAMVIIDALVRLLPGALGDDDSNKHDSFSESVEGGLEFGELRHQAVLGDFDIGLDRQHKARQRQPKCQHEQQAHGNVDHPLESVCALIFHLRLRT